MAKRKAIKLFWSRSGSGNIMYADEGTDLTEKILEGLNNEFDGKKLKYNTPVKFRKRNKR